jgi:hypothetical protein
MKKKNAVVTITFEITPEEHALVLALAVQMAKDGHTTVTNAIPFTYGYLMKLALSALKRTDDEDAAGCTVAA